MNRQRFSGLSVALRDATSTLHREAERAGIMPDLLAGRLDKVDYVGLLFNLHALYAQLEGAFGAQPALTNLQTLLDSGLRRQAALEHDLTILAGANWQSMLTKTAAMSRYQTHLKHLANESPALLAAHAYVRYLGDLNGGRMLDRLILSGPCKAHRDAVRFYAYPEAIDIQETIKAFRQVMDELGEQHSHLHEHLLGEARHGFVAHVELFEELDSRRFDRSAPPAD